MRNRDNKPHAALLSSGSVNSFCTGRSKSRCKNKINTAQYHGMGLAGLNKETIPKIIRVARVLRRAVLRP